MCTSKHVLAETTFNKKSKQENQDKREDQYHPVSQSQFTIGKMK